MQIALPVKVDRHSGTAATIIDCDKLLLCSRVPQNTRLADLQILQTSAKGNVFPKGSLD